MVFRLFAFLRRVVLIGLFVANVGVDMPYLGFWHTLSPSSKS